MRKATWKERPLVVEIITHMFENNPGSVWILRKRVNRKRGIELLARYVFTKAYNRGGVYISNNNKGAALCYRYNNRAYTFKEFWAHLLFIIFAASFKKGFDITRREAYREKQRPASGDYLYFWFLGVMPGGNKAVFELSWELFKESERTGLPIYLETTLERMMRVYERYDFEMYHYWEDKEKDIQYWFMRKKPQKVTRDLNDFAPDQKVPL